MFQKLKTSLFILPKEEKKVECVTNLYNKLNFFGIHILYWTQNKEYVLSVYIGQVFNLTNNTKKHWSYHGGFTRPACPTTKN